MEGDINRGLNTIFESINFNFGEFFIIHWTFLVQCDHSEVSPNYKACFLILIELTLTFYSWKLLLLIQPKMVEPIQKYLIKFTIFDLRWPQWSWEGLKLQCHCTPKIYFTRLILFVYKKKHWHRYWGVKFNLMIDTHGLQHTFHGVQWWWS